MTVGTITNGRGQDHKNNQWGVNKVATGKNGVKTATEASYQLLMQQALSAYRK